MEQYDIPPFAFPSGHSHKTNVFIN